MKIRGIATCRRRMAIPGQSRSHRLVFVREGGTAQADVPFWPLPVEQNE